MSATPRTEAACYTFHSEDVTGCSGYDEYVPASLSRELERENVALRADVLEQCMLNAKGSEREYSLRGRIEQLERENAALREDKERLHRLAYDMAAEMEHHGGEQAFDSLARYRAALGKEGQS